MGQYVGCADCYGLESFIPVAEKFLEAELEGQNGGKTVASLTGMLSLRAEANRHRHAVVYRVELDDLHARAIQAFMDKKEYVDALNLLKKAAKVIEIGKHLGMKKSWRMIPNPELDPYGGDER